VSRTVRYARQCKPLKRNFSTFVGIDLGGTRGKTTALARLSLRPAGPGAPGEPEPGAPAVIVDEVVPRQRGNMPWRDEVLIEQLAELTGGPGTEDGCVVAINAPLTVPACLRCVLPACPGQEQCQDPAVEWLRTAGAQIVHEAVASDRDRIVAIPSGGSISGTSRTVRSRPAGPRLAPYVHRGAEVVMHYERELLPRDTLGLATGRIAARASHLRRLLANHGYRLNHNLIEVSPRATVKALFGRREARGYKRDADPWKTRARIVEELGDLSFSASSRLSKEEVLRNDHCFEALLSGYTAYLWTRDGWQMPSDDAAVFDTDGWIWAPPD
jgi:predicted nuclease with RNAse H fold